MVSDGPLPIRCQRLQPIVSFQEQIKIAISAHDEWKGKLTSAIETGTSEFSPSTVRRDDQCEFGRWLKAIADPSIKASVNYHKCAGLHHRFHETIARVLDLALTGRKDAANEALGLSGDFSKASTSLTTAMSDWERSNPH